MNMHWMDWSVVALAFVVVMAIAYWTRKATRTTADFLAANRCAGRYLLTLSDGIAGLGAITIVATWQQTYKVGFASNWWAGLAGPVSLIMVISGWLIYRYRETRVLTLPQLLEVRYSRKFRITAGIICYTAGVLNYGIFPAVGASFFIHYCGLPLTFELAGLELSTHVVLVTLLVGSSLVVVLSSGQVAVLITDFFQSVFVNIVMVTIVVLLLCRYSIGDIFDGLMIAEPGQSRINPFDTGKSEFNPLYFIIGIAGNIFFRLSWQGNQGYNSAATSPHEAKMARVLSEFRGTATAVSLTLVALVAYMIMNHPDFSHEAEQVNSALAVIENDQVRDQMVVPRTLTLYLPIGLLGAFAAVMLLAFISTNDTYMHSWGSIFVQDVYMPVRRKPLDNRQHLLALRLSIIGVGIFAIVFSSIFRQTQHILYYFAITASIWLGGSGAVIVGALYTRWGTTAAAYAALISGSTISFAGLVLEQVWNSLYDTNFILTGQEIFGIAMVVSFGLYVAVSLLGKRRQFNLDKMLHRGEYVIKGDHQKAEMESATRFRWLNVFGFTKEFTRGDKIIYTLTLFNAGVNMSLFATLSIWATVSSFSDENWKTYHLIMFTYNIVWTLVIFVWLFIGGFRDLFRFNRDLKAARTDLTDDGRVAGEGVDP